MWQTVTLRSDKILYDIRAMTLSMFNVAVAMRSLVFQSAHKHFIVCALVCKNPPKTNKQTNETCPIMFITQAAFFTLMRNDL